MDINTTKNIEKNFEEISDILLDSKSGEFSSLIEDIFGACENFDLDSDDEVQFRTFLEKVFLQMKKYSDE